MRAVAAKRSRTLPVIGATLVALCTISAPALAHTATGTLNKETTNQGRILGKLRERLHERWNHLLHRSRDPSSCHPLHNKQSTRWANHPRR